MPPTKLIMVELEAIGKDVATLVCWVDKKPGLKMNAILTLKDIPNKKWKVQHIYPSTLLDRPALSKWKVGGLK
jgi:hypothetical protein